MTDEILSAEQVGESRIELWDMVAEHPELTTLVHQAFDADDYVAREAIRQLPDEVQTLLSRILAS